MVQYQGKRQEGRDPETLLGTLEYPGGNGEDDREGRGNSDAHGGREHGLSFGRVGGKRVGGT